MKDPPDPGGGNPQDVASYVTVESSMDTDTSVSKSRKRIKLNKICKNCHKKKRRNHHGAPLKETDCSCIGACDSILTNEPIKSVLPITTSQSPPVPTTQSNVLSRKYYGETDMAPFIIHVQKEQTSLTDGTSLHPVTFGNFLKKNNMTNVVNGSVKRIGRNRVSLAFANFKDANLFLNNECLMRHDYKSFVPSFNVTRMGIVRGVPAEWSPEEILDNVSVPIGCGPILKARRINFKVLVEGTTQWKPSQSVVLTFDGQVLPKRIFMCYNALSVELYTFPTIQCYNCCRFGHTKTICRSKPRCYKCGQEHTGESCQVEDDHVICCLCSGSHHAVNKICPEYNRQKQIKSTMAHNCISYIEATKLHPPITKPYADILRSTPPQPSYISPPSNPSHKNSPVTSYKKTVHLKARSPPTIQKGYDHSTHASFAKEYNLPSHSKGYTNKFKSDPKSQITQSPTEIITLVTKLLSQFNILSPSNVALLIQAILNVFQNGQSNSNSPVELSEHSQ